jgi:serine phosphatase RsbU (regulator of sigma subunit)
MTATGRVLTLLGQAERAAPHDLAVLAAEAAQALGAVGSAVYVVDYGQTVLVPVSGAPDREPLPVEGTLAGRAYATLECYETQASDRWHLWVPLAVGPLRLGVLQVVLTSAPSPRQREAWSTTATLIAALLTDRGQYGDELERTRRRLPMQAATEVVWSLLPPTSFGNEQVEISAILEPCYEVGGDVFDYSVNPDLVHVALFDAVGHGMAASLLSTLAINVYRNARRCGLDLVDTYLSIDKWVRAQYPDAFVTAILGELDPSTGRYRRICAGHPAELLIRDGRLVRQFPSPTAMPLGMADLDERPPEATEHGLQPGDNVLFYTDGVIEARSQSGEFFGLPRLAEFLTRALASQLPQPETMRRLIRAILDHQHERLQDDATAVSLRYLTPEHAGTVDPLPDRLPTQRR